jgi:tetratricopeptide (TPR) repeat protein
MLFDLGVIYMRLGDNDEARKYIEDAGSLNQNWAVPLFATAQLDLAAGDKQSNKSVKSRLYQRAILNLTRVISLKPDTPRVRELLSLAYSAAERHQEAIEGGREAVAANPNSAYAHYVLGQAYYQLGAQKDKNEYRNAIAEFNVALTLPAEPLDPQTNSSVKEKIALMKKALGIKR